MGNYRRPRIPAPRRLCVLGEDEITVGDEVLSILLGEDEIACGDLSILPCEDDLVCGERDRRGDEDITRETNRPVRGSLMGGL